MLVVASTAAISKFADVEDSVKGTKIVIGERTVIDSFVKIKPAGGAGDLIIGDDVVINPGVAIYTGNGMVVGNNVMIAANCVFSPTSHEFMDRAVPIRKQGFSKPSPLRKGRTGILIEEDVWIGANSVVLEGAHIQKGAVIAAGSIVKGKLDPYGIYSGAPLKLLGYRR